MAYKPLAVLIRKYGQTSFIDITAYAKTNDLKGYRTRSFEPCWFSITLNFPKDQSLDYIYPDQGDEILICTDNTYTQIFNKCYGKVEEPNKTIIAYNRSVSRFMVQFNLKVSDFDFSQPREIPEGILEFPEFNYDGGLNDYNLDNILQVIFEYSDDSLGGFTNQVVEGFSGTNYPFEKYLVLSYPRLVRSFNASNIFCRSSLRQLCEENGYYFKFNYICYPNDDELVKVLRQIWIYDKSGQMAYSDSSWYAFITDETLISGRVFNPAYYSDQTKPQYLPDSQFPFKISPIQNSIRNYTVIKAYCWDGTLTRYELQVNAQGVSNFLLPDPCADILYIARKPVDIGTSPIYGSQVGVSFTGFEIEADYARFIIAGDSGDFTTDYNNWVINGNSIIRINISGIDYYRKIASISISELEPTYPAIITLLEPLPEVPGIGADYIEIVNNEILYKEDDSTVGLSTGVACTIQQDGGTTQASIRFLELSVPNQGDIIVVIAKKIEVFYDVQSLSESIKKYGVQAPPVLELKGIYSKNQLLEIQNEIQQAEPSLRFNLSTARPYGMCEEGFQLPLNVTDLAVGNFIVDSNTWSMIGYDSKFDCYRIQQDIDISTNRDDITDILRKLNRANKIFTPTSKRHRKKQPEKITIQDSYTATKTDLGLMLLYWKGQEQGGTFINDRAGNYKDGIIKGDISSTWQAGILPDDLSSIRLNGIDNYITYESDSTVFTDFTIHSEFRFNTGDIASKPYHYLAEKSSFINALLSENQTFELFIQSNQLWFGVFDTTHAPFSQKAIFYSCDYVFLENVNYIVDGAFMLQDPNNSNLNKFEVCINGVKQYLTLVVSTISNISAVKVCTNKITAGQWEALPTFPQNFSKLSFLRPLIIYLSFRTETQALAYYNERIA